jgi:hypothetical protein
MKTLLAMLSLVLVMELSFTQPAPAQAQGLYDMVFDAGSVLLETDQGSWGQGYLALSPDGQYIRIYTIEHVVAGTEDEPVETVTIYVPYYEPLPVSVGDFECENRRNDDDRACFVELSRADSALFISWDNGFIPSLRYAEPPEVELEEKVTLVGVPNAQLPGEDPGGWTMYCVWEITNQREMVVQALSVDNTCIRNPVATHGIICHGRSGGPAMLFEYDPDYGFALVLHEDWPITLGEVERGKAGSEQLAPDGNTCYLRLVINRVGNRFEFDEFES